VGDTEVIVFRSMFVIDAVLWFVATYYTTRVLITKFFQSKRRALSLPFVMAAIANGLNHVVMAGLFVAATYWNQNLSLLRITVYGIPISLIIAGHSYMYLGYAIRRSDG